MPTEISPYPMVEVSDAVNRIVAECRPLPVEEVDRDAAFGRVLAENVIASEDQPPFVASTVDGYAICAADGRIPRRLRGDIRAGTIGVALQAGEAVRIMTGAPLPDGADTVVMFEWAALEGDSVVPENEPRPGENLRPIGSDLAAGEPVLAAGAQLGPAEIGLVASLGIGRVSVVRMPRVAILSTGDELVDADSSVHGPVIRDSNGPTLRAAISGWGYPATFLGIAGDSREQQEAMIQRGLEVADVVLTSGGVSVGSHDLIKPIFDRLGTLHFGRINFKPGKPLTFATVEAGGEWATRRLMFGLPGNPVSALVCLHLFVRPALRLLAGERDVLPSIVSGIAGETLRASADRPDYQRALARWESGRLVVRTTGAQGSSRLRSLAGANALAVVPAGSKPVAAGSEVDVILLGPVSGDRTIAGTIAGTKREP